MQDAADVDLLRQYTQHASEEAFAELARRYVGLVYSAALRKTRNAEAAEEIAQAVFIVLARKARGLGEGTKLGGWLYETTRLTAANFLRNEMRRARREHQAYMQSLASEPALEAWSQIMPLLEDAMGALRPKDRDAIVLRFFQGKSFQEIAEAAGATENAAKKRVGHALEKLRRYFVKRGVALTVPAIAGAISAHSAPAAPLALAQTVTVVAAGKGAAASGPVLALVKATLKSLVWEKIKSLLRLGGGFMLAGSALTVALLLSGALPHTAGASPVPFTATLEMQVEWRSRQQEVLSSNLMGVAVSAGAKKAMIEPWAISARSNTVTFIWATSPFAAGEWIVGAQSRERNQSVTNISINNHPVLGCGDPCANLARILYLPSDHPTYKEISSNERYYIPVETFGYRPDEVQFDIKRSSTASPDAISQITAFSPPYYYEGVQGNGSPVKRPFQGPPFSRKLWTLSIDGYTNWNGLLLPLGFSYTRYQDAASRAQAENETAPIAIIRGRLLSVEPGADTHIETRFARTLNVIDFRVTSALGKTISYHASPGAWPRVGSAEFNRMVATNLALLPRDRGRDEAPSRRAAWVRPLVLAACIASLLPIIFALFRKPPYTPTDKMT